MTDDVKQDSVTQKVAEPKKTGAQILAWLLLLMLIALAAAGGFVYTLLTRQHESLVQQVISLRQQASDEVAQSQVLARTVQQLQQAYSAANDNQDITTIYTHLMTVNSQLDHLPLPSAPLQPDHAVAPVIEDSQLSWWEKGLSRSIQALRQIVIIRYSENKTQPLIMPEDQRFLYLNLHAEMQNAIWGVLHRNPTVYHTSLARVMDWVQQYFVQSSPVTATVMQQLTALQSVDVRAQESNRGVT